MGDLGGFIRDLPLSDRVRRNYLVEKDFHIHHILSYLSVDSNLVNDLAFKGGTCLTKAHLGYYRFSEDVDFTWRHQKDWKGLSTAQVKKRCSSIIGDVADEIEAMAADLGFNFLADKNEPDQVGIGSGGRMVTYYLWYSSPITDSEEFLKVQMKLVDVIFDPIQEMDLSTYVDILSLRGERDRLLERYPKEMEAYTRHIQFPCYSAREIFLEKCRAILTRKGVKHRDLIDVVKLENKYGFSIADQTDDIIKKTMPMLGYRRYASNLVSRNPQLEYHVPQHEEAMLLEPLTPSLTERMISIYEELYSISRDITELI
jgi:hypothetical protein